MGPSGWTSEKQRRFLDGWRPSYEACRIDKKYKDFWRSLVSAYLLAFPLVEEMYPGRALSELDEDEAHKYSERLTKLQARLKEWFRWQYNPRSRNATAAITKKSLRSIYRPRTRGLKAYEIYAKLYPKKVSQAQRERCMREGVTGYRILGKWHAVCKELLATASEDESQAVEEALAARAQEVEEDDVEPEEFPPERFQKNIDQLPSLLSVLVDPAARQAGLFALVTLVGPIPNKNGQIDVQTLQFGDKPDTPLFAQVWNDYGPVYVNALSKFVRHHEFSAEVCASRSLHASRKVDEEDSSSGSDTPTPNTVLPLPDTASSINEIALRNSAGSASGSANPLDRLAGQASGSETGSLPGGFISPPPSSQQRQETPAMTSCGLRLPTPVHQVTSMMDLLDDPQLVRWDHGIVAEPQFPNSQLGYHSSIEDYPFVQNGSSFQYNFDDDTSYGSPHGINPVRGVQAPPSHHHAQLQGNFTQRDSARPFHASAPDTAAGGVPNSLHEAPAYQLAPLSYTSRLHPSLQLGGSGFGQQGLGNCPTSPLIATTMPTAPFPPMVAVPPNTSPGSTAFTPTLPRTSFASNPDASSGPRIKPQPTATSVSISGSSSVADALSGPSTTPPPPKSTHISNLWVETDASRGKFRGHKPG